MLVEAVKDHAEVAKNLESASATLEVTRERLIVYEEKAFALQKDLATNIERVKNLEQSGSVSEEVTRELHSSLEATKMALAIAEEENATLKAKALRDAKDLNTFAVMINPLKEEIRSLKHEHAIDIETLEQVGDGLRGDIRGLEANIRKLRDEITTLIKMLSLLICNDNCKGKIMIYKMLQLEKASYKNPLLL